ncbi:MULTISPECIES: flagellar basal body protein [Ferrimonas]|uniref:Flagellar basal body rod protein FlgB n=1 Tax=Ferrimonas sediminum TaxID=718193 RepID=A0A1G8ZZF5_9GAMM|nr:MULTISPECIES: flagellar basal body protein [Ferrimonas]USD36264.1 flagellar basal body rod protein FlgB [Ferrimonas sp. SCSIO 43195]SDK19715.1 flagellar basal-body rod protein FlgB [Ferrimonas sediminum]
MAINLESALGLHAQGLDLRVERTKILAANLANAETPGYQAVDIDFAAAMQRYQSSGEVQRNYQMGYRVPHQMSADGNTVELDQEQARFAANSMDFQTSLTFLNMKINGIRTAIEGQ